MTIATMTLSLRRAESPIMDDERGNDFERMMARDHVNNDDEVEEGDEMIMHPSKG